MKDTRWFVYGFSLATAMGVAYVGCAIFDVLFPSFGLIHWLAPASPWPISGSATGLITGLAMFSIAGFVFGAVYALAWGFWSKWLNW